MMSNAPNDASKCAKRPMPTPTADSSKQSTIAATSSSKQIENLSKVLLMHDLILWTIFCYIWNVDHVRKDILYIGINGFMSLLTESGGTKDDLKLPSDEDLMK
ncbi:Eukaryotic translation initiation factor 5A-2 [Bienertia sinuspersici]